MKGHAHRVAPAHDADLPVVALVGRPNVGKSTLFAFATGRFAETVNAPGTTIGAERRRVHTAAGEACFVDLPGTLALDDRPAGDDPFWRTLADSHPDAILVVANAGDMARHLPLILACRDLGLPLVVAANLADEAAARGVDLDSGRLAQLLAAPVHLTVGRTGEGVPAGRRRCHSARPSAAGLVGRSGAKRHSSGPLLWARAGAADRGGVRIDRGKPLARCGSS
jgi:ferrous iron transport protein B